MIWQGFHSIKELPQGLWDEKIACGDVAMDSRLVRVAERMFPHVRFDYCLGKEMGKTCALILWMTEDHISSTGTPETTGLHFWFDETVMDQARFMDEIQRFTFKSQVIVLRDFIGQTITDWEDTLRGNGFQAEQVLDLCTLVIPDGIHTLDEYPSVLKAKHRYRWNQYRRSLSRELYTVERITDFLPLMDRLYPLYAEVCERAQEYRTEPYPQDYFRIVKEEFADDAVALTIREKATGQYLGFMLLLYGQGSCVHQYIGFHRRDDLFLWHNLTIESIGDALSQNIRRINMGVTHAVAKRKFGAENCKVFVFSKNL